MRKTLLSLVIIALTFVGAPNASAQRGMKALPAEAELNVYPTMKPGEMTPAMQAKLGLHAVELTDTVTVFNYFANLDRFVLETLTRGTIAWADKDEVLRYKNDCTNRIVEASECPKCLERIADMEVALYGMSTEKAQLVQQLEEKANAEQKKSWFSKAFDTLWDIIKFMLVVLALTALWVAFIWLISESWRWLTGRNTSPVPPTPTPVVPVPVAPAPTPVPVVPTPVVVPPAPVAPVPVPTPAPAPTIILPTRHEVILYYEDGTRIVMPSTQQRS
ncbi:MAG: hypothetical protein WAV25_02410 [Minisyncoccia bacterium]